VKRPGRAASEEDQGGVRGGERAAVLRAREVRIGRTWLAVAALLGLALLHGVSLLSCPELPLTDMPFHLAVATVVQGYGGPGNAFVEFFDVNLVGRPNVLHPLFCGLFPDVELGNRVFFALYLVGTPLSLLILLRQLGGNPWFALLGFVFIFNLNFHWGFVGFTFAIPLVLLLVVLLARHAEQPCWSTRFGVALFLAGLFFVHALAALFALLLLGLDSLARNPREPRLLLTDLALGLPTLLLIARWWISRSDPGGAAGESIAAFLLTYYNGEYLSDWWRRLALITANGRFLLPGVKGYLLGTALTVLALSPLVLVVLRDRAAVRAALLAPRHRALLALVGGSLGCWFLLPGHLPGQPVTFQRFAVLALLGMVALSGLVRSPVLRSRSAVALGTLAVLLHLGLYAEYFHDFRRDSADFCDELLPDAPQDARLAGMIFQDEFRGHSVYGHFPSYYIVRREGIATTLMTNFRFGNVRRRASEQRLPRCLRRTADGFPYDGSYGALEYLLTAGEIPELMRSDLARFQPVVRSGRWALLANGASEPLSGLPPR